MSSRPYSIVVFLVIFLVCVFIVVWVLFLNKGTLILSGAGNSTIRLVDYRSFSCENDLCVLSIHPDTYQAVITKNGYYDTSQTLVVNRWQKNPYHVELQIIPYVEEINEETYEDLNNHIIFPDELKKFLPISNNSRTQFLYFDSTDLTVKLWEDGTIRSIAKFRSAGRNLSIQADATFQHALISINRDVYLLNIAIGEKKKVLEKNVSDILWSDDGKQVFIGNIAENKKFYSLYFVENFDLHGSSLALPEGINHLVWSGDNEIVFSSLNGFFRFHIINQTVDTIVEADELEIDEMVLSKDKNSIYYKVKDGYYKVVIGG